jgi:HSP20 family protein
MSGDLFEEMRQFRKEMNRLFDAFFGSEFPEKALTDTSNLNRDIQLFRRPLSDLKETDKELIASIEIPGVDKKDIQLKITENNLEIKVEKKQEVKIEKKNYLKEERSYKGFYRSISLPSRIVPDQVKAYYKDGVLEVVMPKVVEKNKVEKAKKVEIQ